MSAPQHWHEEAKTKELSFLIVFKKLWPFLWKHKLLVVVSFTLVLFYSLIGRSIPLLFGMTVDEVIGKKNVEILPYLALAYFVVEMARTWFSYEQSFRIQRLGNLTLFEIRQKLISHVQRLPLNYFDKNPSGRTVTRVTNDVLALGEIFSQGFAGIFVSLFEMFTIFVTMAILSWKLTGIVSLLVPVLLVVCYVLSRKIRSQFGATKRKLAMINAYVAEHITGMKVTQLFGREQKVIESFQTLSGEYKSLQLKTILYFATMWPTIEGFSIFTISMAIFFGALLQDSLGLSVGALTAYIILLQNFFRPLRIILEKYNQLQNSLSSADRVFQLLDEKKEIEIVSPDLAPTQGRLRFDNLSFAYSEGGALVLKNINLEIQPGESIAIVGRTGSGKSTMISLLQRMYEYTDGAIYIDDVELRTIGLPQLRKKIGVVQQDNFIFSGNFYTNIGLNDPNVSFEKMKWAAAESQCLEMIQRHGGFEAEIQERGANLSHGERQLLAFSRVLAFDPEVLVLDEATANIDSISESRIQTALERVIRGRTSIIIAHRLSTILKCNRIVVLDQGQIREVGSHHELLAHDGIYAKFYNSQTSEHLSEHVSEQAPEQASEQASEQAPKSLGQPKIF